MIGRKGATKALQRFLFFVGWLLSPFTFWNDALINIPLAYITANIVMRFLPVDFLMTILVFYWATNVLGLLMMYLNGKSILREKGHLSLEILKLVGTIVIYSVIVLLMGKAGLLRPLGGL